MIDRKADAARVRAALRRSRVVALLGPRQCGKTTFGRQFVSPDSLNYFDLEEPQSLARLAEPDTALRPLKKLVVIDEIQRRPDLFPLLRVLADRMPLPARFLILGSASPDLLRQSSESLAGRLETVSLEGFRLSDLGAAAQSRHWLRGGFPLAYTARTEPDAKFMTVSGDLIAHSFSCRYATLLPGSTQSDYQAFVLKTLDFVIGELRASFSGVPVYVALGNNNTGCGDYQLDAGSDFLVRAGRIVAAGLPLSEQQQALKEFAKGGYFSLTMEAPMRDTRLIVLNDLFLSPKYTTCAGGPDPAAAITEMAWFRVQPTPIRPVGQIVEMERRERATSPTKPVRHSRWLSTECGEICRFDGLKLSGTAKPSCCSRRS